MFFMYLDKIPLLEAQKQEYALEATSFPNMREFDQKQVQRRYEQLLRPILEASQKVVDSAWQQLRNKVI